MQDPVQDWLNDPTIPAPIRQALQSGLRLDRIELDSEGRFWHQGEPIDDARIEGLFHRSIERTPGGTYLLAVPPFRYPIVVRDMPYRVTAIAIPDAPGLTDGPPPSIRIRLDDDSEEDLDIDTLRHQPGRGLICQVKGRTMTARFSRPSYYALAQCLELPSSGVDLPDGEEPDPVLVLGALRHPIPRV